MTVTISGTNGIDKVQDGTIQSADFAAGVPARNNLPAGTVLQVVQTSTTNSATTSGNTYVPIGISASITPTSSTSKILVQFCSCAYGPTNGYVNVNLYRNSNPVSANPPGLKQSYVQNGGVFYQDISFVYYDSPATTSSTAYSIYFRNGNVGTGSVTFNPDGGTMTLILMEIAA